MGRAQHMLFSNVNVPLANEQARPLTAAFDTSDADSMFSGNINNIQMISMR